MFIQTLQMLSAGFALVFAVISAIAAWRAASSMLEVDAALKRVKELALRLDDAEHNIGLLEAGHDGLMQQMQRQIGRYGALVGRVNQLAPATSTVEDGDGAAETEKERERELLRAKLAAKAMN